MSPGLPETIYDSSAIGQMIEQIAKSIENDGRTGEVCLVAIRRGGEEIATRLTHALARNTGKAPLLGAIDITLYRDDWTMRTQRPVIMRTEIPFAVDNRHIVLVDDVVFTGRTVRAALDELMDFGRPRRVCMAALIDRGGRELPIQPDYIGEKIQCSSEDTIDVVLSGDNPQEDKVIRVKTP